ncbi:MAG: flagellar basal-body rod protein FlgF [Gammaproteobacteria bacterium]|nr:flagellar basal-body rod protein FlgF [Gammaproteobacteria bacterium]
MDRLLYLSMSAAQNTMQAQSVNSHNLANVSTPGFRADLSRFISVPVAGEGFESRVYASQTTPGFNADGGAIQQTGNPLDVAIEGEGYIAIRRTDGSEGYTRAGDFRINSVGMLETGGGHAVLGNGGPIVIPPSEKIEIGSDGTITIRPLGQDAATLATVNRIKLVRPDSANLQKATDGQLVLKDGSVAAPDASVRVTSGTLESSNVNMVEALVDMISLARQFEINIKAMQTVKENDESAAQMLRIS